MQFIRTLFIALLCTVPLQNVAKAEVFDIMADNNFVPVSVDFTGQTLRLYGATDIKGTIIITITAQRQQIHLYKKTKQYGIWMDNKVAQIQAPSYYQMLSTNLISTEDLYAISNNIGIKNIRHFVKLDTNKASKKEIWQNTVETQKRLGKYSYKSSGVVKKGPYLFEGIVQLPSDVRTGTYTVSAFVKTADGIRKVIDKEILIERHGFTKFIYTGARDYPLVYALIAILLSLLIGVGATYRRKTY